MTMSKMFGVVRVAGTALLASLCLPVAVATGQTSTDTPPTRQILDRYCVTCHNERLKTAGLMLDQVDVGDVAGNAAVLEKVVRKLRAGQMPPEGRPRPDAATMDAMATSLELALDRAALADPNPGRVVTRRLNRVEYVNAIEDLLGLEIDGPALLPSDMGAFGFDNNAEVLSITPALMSRYIAAATKISRAAVGSADTRPIVQVYRTGFEERDVRLGEQMPFASHGGLAVRHHFPLDGEYQFTIRLKRDGTSQVIEGIGERAHQIEVRVDRALVRTFEIGGKYPGPDPGTLIAPRDDDFEGIRLHQYRMEADDILEFRLQLNAGTQLLSVVFADTAPTPVGVTDLPGVDMVSIAGPFDGVVPTGTVSRQKIFVCDPTERTEMAEEACAREILGSLARRAYRRPVSDGEVGTLLRAYREGRGDGSFDAGIERGLETLLAMPQFLLRVDARPVDAQAGGVYAISDLELASRLSFFLWRSLPDEELIDLGARDALSTPDVLSTQVERMLADPRASRFMDDFVGQWLQMRDLESHNPDVQLFGAFNDTLRKSMVRETELFFQSQVRDDRPIGELLLADYTYLNEGLARHYGVDDVYGSHFRRVEWDDERRHGLLGHGSLLTVTSYANRTSVVLRGKWVLEALLGSPPPPAPANVPPLDENDAAAPTSLRERMEAHRTNPVCAACHRRMDPLGFALEHFDAIGRWRDTDGGASIDSNIELSGETINDPRAFREALLREGDGEFVKTVTEKMLQYALGRIVMHYDAPLIRKISRELEAENFRWSALIQRVVASDPFQRQRMPMPGDDGVIADVSQ
jgi:cytochrome c5